MNRASIMRKFISIFMLCAVVTVFGGKSALAGVVGSWTFDNDDAGTYDLSGLDNDAEVVGGASFVNHSVLGGKSLLLDGVDAYAKLFTSDSFKGDFSSGEATLSMWVRLDAAAGLNGGLATIGVWAYPSLYPASIAGAMSLKLFLSAGEPAVVNFPPSYNVYQWNHIAVTVDASDVEAGYKVYLNGLPAGEFPMDGTHGNFLAPITPRVGMSYDVSTNTAYYMDGAVDEVKIYNEALTASQVAAMANIADLNADGSVDYGDLAHIGVNWQKGCGLPDWCGGSDFDRDGIVDVGDLAVLAAHWLH